MDRRRFCSDIEISENQFSGMDKIASSLYLDGLVSIPKGFNPAVGGDLNIRNLTSISEGFNPTVGGDLDLGNLASCLDDLSYQKKEPTHPLLWQGGKYILADRIFTEVVAHKGNVWRVKKIGRNETGYLVTNGSGFAHGDTLEEARESLIFKVSNRDTSRFKRMQTDTVLEFGEIISLYRSVTGACEAGVRDFVKQNQIERKAYSIKEVIDRTFGKYGHNKLIDFFTK